MPDRRKRGAQINNMQYNSTRGDQWCDQMEVKEKREERERARGVLIYLQERY